MCRWRPGWSRECVNVSTESIVDEGDSNLLGVGVEIQKGDLTSGEGIFNTL